MNIAIPGRELVQRVLPMLDLLGQNVVAHDGARHQVRKKADEAGDVGESSRRLCRAPVDVDRVAHALERVERDADRQYHFEQRERAGSENAQQAVQVLGGERVVLEKRQQPEVAADGCDQRRLSPRRRRARLADDASANEIEHRRKQHQQDKPRLPPAVEDVACQREKPVPVARQQVVDHQHQTAESRRGKCER